MSRLLKRGLLALAASAGFYFVIYPRIFGTVSPAERRNLLIPPHNEVNLKAAPERRDLIKAGFIWAYHEYEAHAFGADEYHPISKTGTNLTKAGGVGYLIVDALDTMLLMGLDDEYERARKWVHEHLTFDVDGEYNTFETTIRVLGGLLSAHYLSEKQGRPDPIYVQKATDLGDRILAAFETKSGLPTSSINLGKRLGVLSHDGGKVSTAEATTLQLELKYLSHLTDDDKYWRAAEHVMKIVKGSLKSGLAPILMDIDTGLFEPAEIRLGSRGDSFYEYLLKQWLQTDRTETVYRDMYDRAMSDITQHLVQKSVPSGLLYTAELTPRGSLDASDWRLVPKQDHLVCFLGGSLLLGVTEGHDTIPPDPSTFSETEMRDWQTGVGLIETCMETHRTRTGLSPEIAHFRTPSDPDWLVQNVPKDWYIKGMRGHEGNTYDARYMLRPETVESLYIAHRLTGHPQYRRWGWQIWLAIEFHCRLKDGAYATVLNVDWLEDKHEDKMETFFLSETLKYLYLLFDDAETLSLRDVVFNTEAHPLPVFTPTIKSEFT